MEEKNWKKCNNRYELIGRKNVVVVVVVVFFFFFFFFFVEN